MSESATCRAAAQAARVGPSCRRGGRAGDAAAFFSAGHTGASVMAAIGAFGRLPGVDRPALATIIPTRRQPAVLLDSGATVECRPQHLVQFAVMGAAYARVALGCRSPRVGLLSVGEEESKGNELTREAHQLLKTAPIRFRRQRRRAARLCGRRRRDRLRRLHRQRHAEDQRGARRCRPDAVARGTVGDVRHSRRIPAVAAGVPAIPQARRFVGIRRRAARRLERVCVSSVTAARRRRPCATVSRWRRGSSARGWSTSCRESWPRGALAMLARAEWVRVGHIEPAEARLRRARRACEGAEGRRVPASDRAGSGAEPQVNR